MGRLGVVTLLLAAMTASTSAATFGTVVPVRGQLSDIAIDTQRNVLYAANFTANTVEVLSLANNRFMTPISVPPQPSALALSPDNHYLVVGHYQAPLLSPLFTIIDLTTNTQKFVAPGSDSVLAEAFGNGSNALVVTLAGVSLLDPATGTLKSIQVTDFTSNPLPVPWATYPASIISGTSGVSGDGNIIYVLIDLGGSSTTLQYNITTHALHSLGITSSPASGPRSISVNQDGTTFLDGWALLREPSPGSISNIAQFPSPPGILNQGSHAFDWVNNLIYAQLAPGGIQTTQGKSSGAGLLQTFDADNLTVRETFQLQENLAGRSLLSGNSMYSISDSGITVFPVNALATVHRLKALQEDLFFQSAGCAPGLLKQELDIVDPSGNATDFALHSSSPGVTFSQTTGVTPAQIQVLVDPTQLQNQKGTSVVTVQITSTGAVNLPDSVRVLINTKDPDQKGAITNVPGTIVDIVADPNRDRFYLLRQDKNEVLVFDGTTLQQVATLRTGNTPMQMAIYLDSLLVTNDNSQIINVYDLSQSVPQPAGYVTMPQANYGRSIAVAKDNILVTTRPVGDSPKIAVVDLLSMSASISANIASIYKNQIDLNSVLTASPSQQTIFMAMANGTVGIFDASARAFVASRQDITAGLSGGYAALSDDRYIAGNNVFNTALVPIGQVDLSGGISSGITTLNDQALVSSTIAGAPSGLLQHFALDTLGSTNSIKTSEAPNLVATITRIPVGQEGQTIMPFTRNVAALSNGNTIIQLSTSGFSAFPVIPDTTIATPPSISAVTNAADQAPAIAPGGLVTVWGSTLSNGSMAASTLPLGNGLNNVCLYVGSIPVPTLFVSPNQINAQLPFQLPANPSLVVTNENGSSAPFKLAAQPSAPAIFRAADGTPLIIRTVDGKMITDSTPIHLNEILNIYLTGLGTVTPDVAAGAGAPASPLAVTSTKPTVYIGGSQLFNLWTGLVPGLVGVYQINAQVPFHNVPTGSNIPFTIVQGSAQTQVKLRVEQ